ncbi:transposase [Microseira wollei]|uniref:Transposase n=1 Tax=Microseira wollei NIES-4236 TaxID=2530354 RepID=A0AAV3XS11_9CYAN|nr:transposase [Microseira wollei NIES-4236]
MIAEFFPNAKVVFDRFHVMKLVNQALNKIRIQAQFRFGNLKKSADLTEAELDKLNKYYFSLPVSKLLIISKNNFA